MYVPHERRSVILRLLEQRGSIRTAVVADELNVTEETIRTDLIALQKQNLLKRVHGGAVYIPPSGGRDDETRVDCQLIARLLPHLHDGETIYLDPCLLTRALCSRLGDLRCKIILVAPDMTSLLSSPVQPQRLFLPGGELEKMSKLIAPMSDAPAFMRSYPPDVAVLSPDAVSSRSRVAYFNPLRARWAKEATRVAGVCIIMASSAVFNARAPHPIKCSPSLLITEDNLPNSFSGIPTELIPALSVEDIRNSSNDEIYGRM